MTLGEAIRHRLLGGHVWEVEEIQAYGHDLDEMSLAIERRCAVCGGTRADVAEIDVRRPELMDDHLAGVDRP